MPSQPTTAEVLYQSVIAFLMLFILARILGKRQIAQLTFFDYIAGITIGNIAASWSLDQVKTTHATISLIIWTGLCLLMVVVQRKTYRGRLWLDGRPIVVIEDGQVLERNLKKAKLSIEELMLLLRQKDAFKLSDVEFAIFENNGSLSVLKKTDLQPVTPRDLSIPVLTEREPRLIIIDGHVMERTLQEMGYTTTWLLAEISKHGAKDVKDVFVAQLDSNGTMYVDLYHDRLQKPTIKQKPLVAATLKKLQADLELFSLETRNPEAKRNYEAMAKQLKALTQELLPYLKE